MDEDIQNIEIESIEVSGFVKKGTENVFTIEVLWSNDLDVVEVSRRYSDFVAFHRALLTRCHGSQDFPMLPSFWELFDNLFNDENTLTQPKIHLLNDYCSFLNEYNNRLVKSFFECTQYDSSLRQRHSVSKSPVCSSRFAGMSHKCLVLMDYCRGTFSVKAGDIVVSMGQDKQDWSLIGLKNGGRMQFDWLPTIYLLDIEGENDPLVKNLITYFNDIQHNNDDVLSCQDDMSCRPGSDTRSSSSLSSSGRESADLMKEGVLYCQYTLSEDCHLSCPFSDDVLINRGDKVTVIDKDTDGWWYVCSINSNEGWLPSTILELRGTTSLHTKRKRDLDIIHYPSDVFVKQISCHASKSYQASQYDELSIKAGDWVKVLYESPSGWWTIKFGGSVGLVPGMYLTKNTERTSLPFSRSASYSIGFNASQLSEPPPRRETFSLTSSPQPAIIEDAILLIESGSIEQQYNYDHTSRESSSAIASPQPMMFMNDEGSLSEGEEYSSSKRRHYTLSQLSTLVDHSNSLQQLTFDVTSPYDTHNKVTLLSDCGHVNGRTFSATIDENTISSMPAVDCLMAVRPSLGEIGKQVSHHEGISDCDQNSNNKLSNQYTVLSSSIDNSSTIVSKTVSLDMADLSTQLIPTVS